MGILPTGAGENKWRQEICWRLQSSVPGPPSHFNPGARLKGMLPPGHTASAF